MPGSALCCSLKAAGTQPEVGPQLRHHRRAGIPTRSVLKPAAPAPAPCGSFPRRPRVWKRLQTLQGPPVTSRSTTLSDQTGCQGDA